MFRLGLLLVLMSACPGSTTPALPPSAPPEDPGAPVESPRARSADSPLAHIADRDEDGLVDEVDACPEAAECLNGFDDEDGCPDEVPAAVRALAGVIEGLRFELNKGTIKAASYVQLDAVVEVLQAHPQVTVEIRNHRAADGGPVYGRDITQIRARSVMKYLIEHGVAPERVVAQGYGETMPIDTNRTAEGRANNRRTELVLTGPAQMLESEGCGKLD